MESIRQRIVRRFADEALEREDDSDAELANALYWMLGSVRIDLTIDGWAVFHVARESTESIEAVGLMTLLPGGSVPMTVRVTAEQDDLVWAAEAGRQDERWLALSGSKRWQRVYLYATGARSEPDWEWGASYRGVLRAQLSPHRQSTHETED